MFVEAVFKVKSVCFYIPSSEQKSEGKNTILKTIATNCIYQDEM